MHPPKPTDPENDHETQVYWQVKGPHWSYVLYAEKSAHPMEIATRAVERVWGEEGESWKKDFQDEGHLLTEADQEPSLSILLAVSHEEMQSQDEHFLVSTSIVLANAGFYNEANRMERDWAKIPHEQQISQLLKLLEGEESETLE